jgi:penicillin-binding protein 2
MTLGKAFSDNLIVEKRSVTHLGRGDEDTWWAGAGRMLLFVLGLLIAFAVLLWRLIDLTLVGGYEYRALADGNRTRELTIHAPRGNLIDRTGKPLTVNTPSYRLLLPCEGTNTTGECAKQLTKVEGERLTQQGLTAGHFLEVDYTRQYVLGELIAHALGYIGELSAQELADPYYIGRNYTLGSRIGRMGVEEVFEDRLRGRDGKQLVEVDSQGKILRVLGTQKEVPGEDINLSLDAGLSEVAADAFPKDAKGAIIVTKPQTGEILAMYSSPSFDPNQFVAGLSVDAYQTIMENPDLPMFNRSIGGVYPPGSTFKIITAIGGLEEQTITEATTVEDTGVITIGPFRFPNWYFTQYGRTEGLVDIVKALRRSNDIFFYKAGEALGITKLASWARKFGVGKPLGVELSGEAGGLMPDPAWKNSRFTTPEDLAARNNEWYVGDTYHVAIGQGYLLTTPLQVNAWANVVASGGQLCQPTIEKVTSDRRQATSHCKDLGIKEETLRLVTEGMREACASGGTGWPLFDFSILRSDQPARNASHSDAGGSDQSATPSAHRIRVPVACKTGTAEFGDPKERTHAWFTAFAPIPDAYVPADVKTTESYISGEPEIAVTVLVEGAGEGSNVAAPIAKKIFEAWFGR